METATASDGAVPDDQLVERSRRGDRTAFDEIVTRHRTVVFRTAYRLLGRHEDADEAAQLTFLRAWRGLEGFRGDAALRTWLVRITINVARSMRAVSSDEGRVHRLEPETLPDRAEGSEERVGRRQLGLAVRRAVEGLPPRQREVVTLKIFSDMTHREVADALGLSEGAVKAHLHQAVANLRRRMAGQGAGT